jgi:hypothetical protein
MSDEVEISVRVPRDALVYRPAPPDLVTQHNVLDAIGLKPRQFLEFIRTAPLAVVKIGRTRGVRREELLGYLDTLTERATNGGATEAREVPLAERLGLEAA